MYTAGATIPDILSAIEILSPPAGHGVMVLLADEGRPDLEELVAALRETGLPFFGGFFPGLIAEGRQRDQGALVEAMPLHVPPQVVQGLEAGRVKLPETLTGLGLESPDSLTCIVLADGLAGYITPALKQLQNAMGPTAHYFGGGAGSLSLQQQPCVFTAEGLFQDALVVACADVQSSLGVSHGWKELMGPVIATRTRGNIIVELDWEPAIDLYRAVVEKDSGKTLTREHFFEIAKSYPFGLHRDGTEPIVRDPIAVDEDGCLRCVAEVPQNAVIAIMKGEPAHLIDAARQAAAQAAGGQGASRGIWVVDCISRTIFLGDGFDEELDAVAEAVAGQGAPIQGLLTLGEISSHGDGTLSFFNKTIVVGALHG
jgi:hypothetical protein